MLDPARRNILSLQAQATSILLKLAATKLTGTTFSFIWRLMLRCAVLRGVEGKDTHHRYLKNLLQLSTATHHAIQVRDTLPMQTYRQF